MATQFGQRSAATIGDNLHATQPRSHEENREKVCVLCLNERGDKAIRKVMNVHPREKEPDGWQFKHLSEENIIRRWVPGFNISNPLMPCGLCKRCIFIVNDTRDGKDVEHELLLPEDFRCIGYHPPTRSVEGVICSCNFCKLGQLKSSAFQAWRFGKKTKSRAKMRKQAQNHNDRIGWICPDCCQGVAAGVSKAQHMRQDCNVEDRPDKGLRMPTSSKVAQNLLETLPAEVAAKFVSSYLQQQQQQQSSNSDGAGPSTSHGSGDMEDVETNVVLIPRAHGPPMTVEIKDLHRPRREAAKRITFTGSEILILQTEAGLSRRQMQRILAGMRIKLGLKCIEKRMDQVFSEHNSQYADFFTAKFETFEDKDGMPIGMPLVYCSDLVGFLEKVEENRGVAGRGKKRKLGGDSGKGFLKLTLSLYDEEVDPSERPRKKARRSREEGITATAEETGQKRILLLAVVPTIPESAANLKKLLNIVGVNSVPYTVTGDLKFLHPLFGLKGCSSLHPCLFCNQLRQKGKWDEENEVQLRTFGGLDEQFNKLPDNGKTTTAITRQTESVIGECLVRCEDDMDEKTVLAKVGMPSVHLLLSVNDILNKVAEICFDGNRSVMLDLLRTEVGVVPHSYQGREGAFAGTFFDEKKFKEIKILLLQAQSVRQSWISSMYCSSTWMKQGTKELPF